MSQTKIPLPVRPRTYRFALTPLADAMFQLLIFFMLTSSLTPYSLLPVQNGTASESRDAGGNDTAAVPQPPTSSQTMMTWTLEPGRIVVGGQVFELAQRDLLAEQLAQSGTSEIVLVVSDTALVQDVATVLSWLSTTNVQSVRVAGGAV